ncbi:MAG: radical SAM protein [Pseudomonadota bacterium]
MRYSGKKIVLAQPTGYNWVPGQEDITRDVSVMAPVGLCSMAAYLASRGIEARILDGYAKPRPLKAWVDSIRSFNPSWLGISATTSGFLEAVRLAEAVKAAAAGIRVIMGGVHVSGLKQRCLEDFDAIDFGIVGEGEETLERLIRREGADLGDVPGILYRDAGDARQVSFTGLNRKMISLDSLPFPAYEMLDGYPRAYRLPIFSFPSHPSASVISSRGCPYRCSYCDRSVFRRSFRYNSPDYMIAHLEYMARRWGIRHVTFYDDIFTASRKRIEAFCGLMARKQPGITFNCAVRANEVDEDLVRMLKAAGCWQISFGVESGDPGIVKLHRRRSDLHEIRAKVDLVKRFGIRAKGLFIMGLPGDTEETIRRTIDYACSTDFDEVNVSKFTPFPGAPVYEGIRDHGEFDEDWPKMNLLNFCFVPKGLTRARLEELYREFLRRFYERPSTLFRYSKLMVKSPYNLVMLAGNLPGFLKYLRWIKKG